MPADDRPKGSEDPPGWERPPSPAFGRPIQNHLCAHLRDLYDALAPPPLPAHMTRLLDRLESRDDPERHL
jgi:hypothetical protein